MEILLAKILLPVCFFAGIAWRNHRRKKANG
jgi:hypothetical protein